MQHDESVNFGQGNLSKKAFQELGLWADNLSHHKFSELAYNLGPSWKLPVLMKVSSALLGTCPVSRLCLGLSFVLIKTNSIQKAYCKHRNVENQSFDVAIQALTCPSNLHGKHLHEIAGVNKNMSIIMIVHV